MQTFQQFKQEFAQFEQDVLTLQLNQGAENRETVRYKIIKYREKEVEYERLLRIYKKQEDESVGNEIKILQDRLRETSIKINEIDYIDSQLDRKKLLDKIHNFTIFLLSCLPFCSFSGLFLLFMYLRQINLNDSFYIILSETSGIIFLLVAGIWLGVSHFFVPYYFSLIRVEVIENPHRMNKIIQNKYRFYTLYLFAVFGFSWFFCIPLLNSLWLPIFPAASWTLFAFLFHVIFMSVYYFKNHEWKILMPFVLLLLWVFSTAIITAVFGSYQDYSDRKNGHWVNLELFFTTAGFTQSNPYYFKLDESFVKNINNKELSLLRKKYPVIMDGRESYHESYLYGRIMVDLKDIKILCSVKEENGSRFCHRFSGSDLQRMDWITDEAPKQAEQPAQIPIIRKLLRFLSSCKG